MTATRLAVFDRSTEKAYVILEEIMAGLGTESIDDAYLALRATLHALRDRLFVGEAVQLAAQLPLVVKGIYYEGWQPAKTPHPIHRAQEFLDEVAAHIPRPQPTEPLVRTVLDVLARHVSEGEIRQVKGALPREIQELWAH